MAIWKRLKKFDPDKEEDFKNEVEENGGIEKGDKLAMLISAFLVFIPAAMIVLAVFVLIAWLFT